MGLPMNERGVVIQRQSSVQTFSERSALSGDRLINGAITLPVPDQPGVFYRVSGTEYRQMTSEQREQVYREVIAWASEHFPLPTLSTRTRKLEQHAAELPPSNEGGVDA